MVRSIWLVLGELTLTTPQRIAASAAVILAILTVRAIVRQYRDTRREELDTLGRLVLSTLIATATAAGVLGLIGLWGLGEELVSVYHRLDVAEQAPNIVLAIVVLGGAYALTDFLGQIIRELVSTGEAITDHQQEVLYRLTQLGIYTVALLVVIGLFTDNLGGLLVGAGFLGIVVGMAARKTLGSVLSGIVLMFSRPFEVGDWVQFDEYEGTVTDITIVHTCLQTFDGEYVTIPNDEVAGNPIVDRSRNGRLRIEVEVGVDYAADPERAAEIARKVAADVDDVGSTPAPRVVAKRFGDSAVVLGVRFWIDNPSARKRWRTQTNVITAVHEAFSEAGITIPFPQRTLESRSTEESVTVGNPRESDSATVESDGSGSAGVRGGR